MKYLRIYFENGKLKMAIDKNNNISLPDANEIEKGFDLQPIKINNNIHLIGEQTMTMQILSKLLLPIVGLLTPEIKVLFVEFIQGIHQKALLTPNIFDDILTGFLCDIFGVNKAPQTKEQITNN